MHHCHVYVSDIDIGVWNELQDELPGSLAERQQITASRYILNMPDIPETYQCLQCGKKYHYKTSLSRHMRLECGKVPQFQCPFCPHRAKLNWNLQKHIKIKHLHSL